MSTYEDCGRGGTTGTASARTAAQPGRPDQDRPGGRTRACPNCRLPSPPARLWEDGCYTAYRDLAEEGPRRRVLPRRLHLRVRHRAAASGRTRHEPTSASETITLDDYRTRYAPYKPDPDLQAAHQQRAVDRHLGRPRGASTTGPTSTLRGRSRPSEFLVRRANAFRAYWEHMPLRLAQSPTGPGHAALPPAPVTADWPSSTCSTPGSTARPGVRRRHQGARPEATGPGPHDHRRRPGEVAARRLDGVAVALERDGPPDRDRPARHQGRPGRPGPDGHLGRLRGLARPGPRRCRAAQGPQPGLDRRRPAPQRRL